MAARGLGYFWAYVGRWLYAFEHINFNGRYPFTRPVLDRPLRDPNTAEDEDI